MTPIEKLREGGTPVLDGRCSMVRYNNQPNNGVSGGGSIGEEVQLGGTRGGGCLLVDLGNEMSNEKNKNREGNRAVSFDGFCWMG